MEVLGRICVAELVDEEASPLLSHLGSHGVPLRCLDLLNTLNYTTFNHPDHLTKCFEFLTKRQMKEGGSIDR